MIAIPKSSAVAIAKRQITSLSGAPIGKALKWLGLPETMKLNALNSFALLAGKDGRVPILDTGAAPAQIGTREALRSCDASVGLVRVEMVQR